MKEIVIKEIPEIEPNETVIINGVRVTALPVPTGIVMEHLCSACALHALGSVCCAQLKCPVISEHHTNALLYVPAGKEQIGKDLIQAEKNYAEAFNQLEEDPIGERGESVIDTRVPIDNNMSDCYNRRDCNVCAFKTGPSNVRVCGDACCDGMVYMRVGHLGLLQKLWEAHDQRIRLINELWKKED